MLDILKSKNQTKRDILIICHEIFHIIISWVKRGSKVFRNLPWQLLNKCDAGERLQWRRLLDNRLNNLFGRLEVPDTLSRRGKSDAQARRFLATEAESGTDLYGNDVFATRQKRDKNPHKCRETSSLWMRLSLRRAPYFIFTHFAREINVLHLLTRNTLWKLERITAS